MMKNIAQAILLVITCSTYSKVEIFLKILFIFFSPNNQVQNIQWQNLIIQLLQKPQHLLHH